MLRIPLVSIITACGMATVVSVAEGQPPRSIGQYLGIGWSDGYHARAACPPKRHAVHHAAAATAAAAAPLPWWKIPASDGEELPRPASKSAAPNGNFPPSGASLFRQPGEGSSVAAATPIQ